MFNNFIVDYGPMLASKISKNKNQLLPTIFL